MLVDRERELLTKRKEIKEKNKTIVGLSEKQNYLFASSTLAFGLFDAV